MLEETLWSLDPVNETVVNQTSNLYFYSQKPNPLIKLAVGLDTRKKRTKKSLQALNTFSSLLQYHRWKIKRTRILLAMHAGIMQLVWILLANSCKFKKVSIGICWENDIFPYGISQNHPAVQLLVLWLVAQKDNFLKFCLFLPELQNLLCPLRKWKCFLSINACNDKAP